MSYASTSHGLPRGVYETILRDEAHHRRLGGLYFEWALSRIDEEEARRLGQVLLGALRGLAPFWKSRAARTLSPPPWSEDDLKALGWSGALEVCAHREKVAARDILDPLETIGIAIGREEREELLAE